MSAIHDLFHGPNRAVPGQADNLRRALVCAGTSPDAQGLCRAVFGTGQGPGRAVLRARFLRDDAPRPAVTGR